MQKDALYYPHIGLQNPEWIKAMALFYDNIYRIVPDNVIPDDNQELLALLEEGSIGKRIDPSSYSKSASEEFMSKLEVWDAAALDRAPEDEQQISKIHLDKTDHHVRELFRKSGFQTENDWMYVPTEIASNYMLYLATDISKKNNLSLITNNWGAWTGTSYFNLNGQIDESISPDLNAEHISDPFALFCILVDEITPINISEIPSEDILKFRNTRSDEITNFRNCIGNLHSELQLIDSRDIKMDLIEKRTKELKTAKDDYHKSADILKAKRWFGTAMMGFPAPITFATLMNIPTASTLTLGATGIALGALYNIKSTENELKKLSKENPVSCLVEMNHSFKNYTISRGGGDMNYHAWNCMEEFIND